MARHIKHGDATRRPDGNGTHERAGRVPESRSPQHERRPQRTHGGDDESSSELQGEDTLTDRIVQLVQGRIAERASKPMSDLGKLARALRVTSEQLEGNVTAPLVSRAADGIEQAVGAVHRDGREVVELIERFARKRPLAFCGSALMLGVGAGRFLKSSAREREREPSESRSARRRNTSLETRGHES